MKTKDKKSIYEKIPKIDYLQGVQNCLQNEVGPYFDMIENIRKEKRKIVGFWALSRLMFPVIDALASVLYRPSKNYKRNQLPEKLLRNIGVKYPHLVWEMFRHPIIHSDTLRGASYRNQYVTWGIKHHGGDHLCFTNHVCIDLKKLYEDLVNFITEEKKKCKPTQHTYWERGIKFTSKINASLKDEFQRIKNESKTKK